MAISPDNAARSEYDSLIHYLNLFDWKNNQYDIMSQFVQLTYEESIFYKMIHGSLFMKDTIDFPTLLPLVGEERLKCSFARQEVLGADNGFVGGQLSPIVFDLPIYSMDGKYQDSGSRKRQTYTLNFSSHLPYLNLNNKIFAKYENMKCSDIVAQIYENYLKEDPPYYKPLIVEETDVPIDFHAQNIHPVAAINKLCKKSVSAEGNGCLYVFFENRDAYYFVSLGKLMKQEPVLALTCELKNVHANDGTLGSLRKDLKKQLYNVDNYRRLSSFDVLDAATSGEASSSLLGIDPVSRRFYYTEFDIRGDDSTGEKIWEKYPHLGDAKPFLPTSKMFVPPRTNMITRITDFGWSENEYLSERSSEKPIYMPEQVSLLRNAQINQIDKNIICTTVSGDPRLKVGDVVEFRIPEILGISGSKSLEELDKYVQGKYLVMQMTHVIVGNEYHMNIQLAKDGYHSEIVNRNALDYSAMKS